MTTPLPRILLLFAALLCFSFTNKCSAAGNDSLEVKELLNWINKQLILNGNKSDILLDASPINPKVDLGEALFKGLSAEDSAMADSLYTVGINSKINHQWENNLVSFAKIISDAKVNVLLKHEDATIVSQESIFYDQPYLVPAHSAKSTYFQKGHPPILWLSYPIFSSNKKYALIRIEFACSISLCGWGGTYFLKKSADNKWIIVWCCCYMS